MRASIPVIAALALVHMFGMRQTGAEDDHAVVVALHFRIRPLPPFPPLRLVPLRTGAARADAGRGIGFVLGDASGGTGARLRDEHMQQTEEGPLR